MNLLDVDAVTGATEYQTRSHCLSESFGLTILLSAAYNFSWLFRWIYWNVLELRFLPDLLEES
jgi:hypothetical protein